MEIAAYTLDIPHLSCRSAKYQSGYREFALMRALRMTVRPARGQLCGPQHGRPGYRDDRPAVHGGIGMTIKKPIHLKAGRAKTDHRPDHQAPWPQG